MFVGCSAQYNKCKALYNEMHRINMAIAEKQEKYELMKKELEENYNSLSDEEKLLFEVKKGEGDYI